MIRIIFLSLVTLTLACGNTRPEPAEAPGQLPAAEQAAAPAETSVAAPRTELRAETDRAQSRKPAAAPTKTPHTHAAKTAAQATPAEAAEVPAKSALPETAVVVEPIPADAPAIPFGATVSPSVVSTDAAVSAPVQTTPVQPAPVVQPLDKPIVASRKHFLPTRRRIDREINKLKFAYKGEMMVGLTASYGTLSGDNADFLTILSNIKANATVATIKPFLGYFYSDNHAVGIRFGYTYANGTINSATFDLGPSNDLSADIPYVKLKSNNYAFGIFHRSYAGLDPKGRFGLFAEFELSMSMGTSEFAYDQNKTRKESFSDNTQLKLSFNPGAAVYIFPNVCATLSFGLGGIQYTSVTQKDADGNKIGSRKYSKMNFKLNIAAINIGMNVHLWDKKKK